MDGKEFPKFEEFAKFMSTEAETARNPVTFLSASFNWMNFCSVNQEDPFREKPALLFFKLYHIDAFLDNEGVHKVRCRLNNSSFPDPSKHPANQGITNQSSSLLSFMER